MGLIVLPFKNNFIQILVIIVGGRHLPLLQAISNLEHMDARNFEDGEKRRNKVLKREDSEEKSIEVLKEKLG